jgi:hypothetical protein
VRPGYAERRLRVRPGYTTSNPSRSGFEAIAVALRPALALLQIQGLHTVGRRTVDMVSTT